MHLRTLLLAAAAPFALAACSQSSAPEQSASTENEAPSAQAEAGAIQSDAISGVYTPDPFHRYITFSYQHQGYSHPYLRWREWTGELNWDADAPENSSVSVTIDVNSVDSGVDAFDGHLASANFFDAENYPEITFVSTKVEKTGANTGKITGDLTIKDVTKPVTLDVVFNKGGFDERGNSYKLGFSGVASVKRSDFGVGAYVPIVGDEVDIVIETEWLMPAPDSE